MSEFAKDVQKRIDSLEGQLAEASNARATLHKTVDRLQGERQEAEYLLKWALNWTGKKAFVKDKNLDVWRERAILWTENRPKEWGQAQDLKSLKSFVIPKGTIGRPDNA